MAAMVSANEKSSRTPPGLLHFGLETPLAVWAALLTGSHALIALVLGLILELTDSVSPAVRRALAVPEAVGAGAARFKSAGALGGVFAEPRAV
jgi:hypothetical protein